MIARPGMRQGLRMVLCVRTCQRAYLYWFAVTKLCAWRNAIIDFTCNPDIRAAMHGNAKHVSSLRFCPGAVTLLQYSAEPMYARAICPMRDRTQPNLQHTGVLVLSGWAIPCVWAPGTGKQQPSCPPRSTRRSPHFPPPAFRNTRFASSRVCRGLLKNFLFWLWCPTSCLKKLNSEAS